MRLHGNRVLLSSIIALLCLVSTSAEQIGIFEIEDNSTARLLQNFSVSPVSCLEDQLWGLVVLYIMAVMSRLLEGWLLPTVFAVTKQWVLVLKHGFCTMFVVCCAPPAPASKGKIFAGTGIVYFTANELAAAERDAKELELRVQAEMDTKEAEKAVLSRNLKTVLAALSGARQKGEVRDALCRRLGEQMELIVVQGNNALEMKADLQRTRDKLVCCQRDVQKLATENELLRSKIAKLRTTTPGADSKLSTASVAQQARWEDSVYFVPGYESVMDGANVCPIPGKAHLSANNGSAATLVTASPSINGSSPSTNGSSSSSIVFVNAPVSPSSSGGSVAAASPPSPCKANAKVASNKTKLGKKKQ